VYTSEGRKRRTIYGKTRQEVAAKLSKALADREGGLTFDAGSLTVGGIWPAGSLTPFEIP
jgi:integrase